MPLLEVLTRCYQRPRMLAANMASLAAQTSRDYQQCLLVDKEGYGIAGAQQRLAAQAPHLVGDYIWILDDDDVCIHPTLVAELHQFAVLESPDVVMVRMDHGDYGILPGPKHWGKRPVRTGIGCSAYIVERHVWQWHAAMFESGKYDADFDFIDAIWESKPRVIWHDVIASRVQRISRGAPE